MTKTFDVLCEGYIATMAIKKDGSENLRIGEIQNRLLFWANQFGATPIDQITPDMVDDALVALGQRGKLQPRRKKASVELSTNLSSATIARYFSELASCFKYAKKQKLVSRTWVPPTRGADLPEQDDPDTRYFDSAQVANLVKIARLLDVHWGRMTALIEVAFCTGLRSGNLKELDWSQVDLNAAVVTVARTKNGDPILAPLSTNARMELEKISGKQGLVFAGKQGNAYHWRKLWDKVTSEAGFAGYNFHLLRHSCGSAMAKAGVSQANIMSIMGHRSLQASRRYMHLNVAGKQDVVARVFG
jgi:integrase